MNLPNQITTLRLALTLPFVMLCYWPDGQAKGWALGVFVAACLTDLLDGLIARKSGQVSPLGRLFDPLADKVLMVAVFTMLAMEARMPGWIVIAVLAREFFVTGIRQIALGQGITVDTEPLGVATQTSQVIVALYFLLQRATEHGPYTLVTDFPWASALMYAMALITIASGLRYFWRNRHLFSDA
jgi:CDP-diacylglycerol---glycerol-3-phosphate 3-phosphatidyltransferase